MEQATRNLLTLAEAKKSGDKYYQGRPCKKGHSGVRQTANRNCVECRILWTREYNYHAKPKRQEWLKDNKERIRPIHKNNYLKAKFGITLDEYETKKNSQNGLCAICKKALGMGKKCHLDHCHSTGKIRGMLCSECNTGLGKFVDQPDLLRAAANYIEEHL